MRKKILAALQLPLPYHGASLRNQEFINSPIINNKLDLQYFEIQTSSSVGNIGEVETKKIFKTLSLFFRSFYIAVKFRPDIFYITLSTSSVGFVKDCLILLAAKPFSKKTYVHFRNQGLKKTYSNIFFRQLGKAALYKSEALVLSKSLMDDISVQYKISKITVVNNCIDDSDALKIGDIEKKYSPRDFEFNIHNHLVNKGDEFWFYHVSNLSEEKGSIDVIKAFISLKKRCNNKCKLVMIGAWDNNYVEAKVKDIIEKSSIDKHDIIFTGALYNEKKFDVINICDALIFPTKYKKECFPGVVLEAMCCKKPIIATKHAALPDIIEDGKEGYLIDKGDLVGLEKKMFYFLENKDRCAEMGLNARLKYTEKYTRDIVHAGIVNVMAK